MPCGPSGCGPSRRTSASGSTSKRTTLKKKPKPKTQKSGANCGSCCTYKSKARPKKKVAKKTVSRGNRRQNGCCDSSSDNSDSFECSCSSCMSSSYDSDSCSSDSDCCGRRPGRKNACGY